MDRWVGGQVGVGVWAVARWVGVGVWAVAGWIGVCGCVGSGWVDRWVWLCGQ